MKCFVMSVLDALCLFAHGDQLQCLKIESVQHKIMYVFVIDLFFIGESVVHLEMHKGIRSCSLFKMCVKYW